MKVLFLLQRPESWINIESVWEAMRARGTFSLTLWVLPYHTRPSELSKAKLSDTCRLLEALRVEYHLWKESDSLKAGDYDVIVLTNPYDSERHPNLRFPKIRKCAPVTVYIPYGLAVGGGRKNFRLQYAQPVHLGCTILCARSEWERNQYKRARGSEPNNVEVLGHPRFDAVSKRYAHLAAQRRDCEASHTTVLWNSHFSFGRRYMFTSNFSTLDLLGPEIFEFARQNSSRMKLWWRPHPGTLAALVDEGMISSQDLPALRDELSASGIHLDESPDHIPAFAESDALITDVGSFLMEYLITEKPLLTLLDPRGEGVNDEAALLIRKTGSTSTPEGLREFLEGVLAGKVSKSTLNARKHTLPMADGHAGERLVDRIETLVQQASLGGSRSDVEHNDDFSSEPSTSRLKVRCSIVQRQDTPVLDRLITRLREHRAQKEGVGKIGFKCRKLVGALRTEMIERAKVNPILSRPALWLRDFIQRLNNPVV